MFLANGMIQTWPLFDAILLTLSRFKYITWMDREWKASWISFVCSFFKWRHFAAYTKYVCHAPCRVTLLKCFPSLAATAHCIVTRCFIMYFIVRYWDRPSEYRLENIIYLKNTNDLPCLKELLKKNNKIKSFLQVLT